ncbi:ecotin family protein [Thaumasiovibrio sp. DFM-14]|uniref:ecotin family protein n=1 Tax=Thaumasiovibrio sp. DFM-14 TaxID=3384792 RepID=UPI0039A13172
MKKLFGAAVLVLCSNAVVAQPESAHMFSAELYPELTMHAFSLDSRENENDSLLQVVARKQVEADCNVRNLSVAVEKKSLEGWGYPYYVVTESPARGTTLLPCEVEVRLLESARGELYRYNSKVPLVIYAPADMDIDYRVWSPEK